MATLLIELIQPLLLHVCRYGEKVAVAVVVHGRERLATASSRLDFAHSLLAHCRQTLPAFKVCGSVL